MNGWDILILIAVIALLGFAVWLNVHKKKKGGGCCGDCCGCADATHCASATQCAANEKRKKKNNK